MAEHIDAMRELTAAELSALFSNLSKGSDKQYRAEEAQAFSVLAAYYQDKAEKPVSATSADLADRIQVDLSSYPAASQTAADAADRGAMRALVWGEKVTKILSSLLSRYEKSGEALLEENHIYVCDICGFVYVGKTPPDICPVCKVPNLKINQVKRGVM